MSNIASPRLSTNIHSPTSSSRSSISLDRQSLPSTAQRRNKLALRDYYNLKSAPHTEPPATTPNEDTLPPSELDAPSFDASAYVINILAKEGLEGVLRVEAGLVSDVRGFDGERKALVYDNYSKLIAATETIRNMRTNMDPLTPMTLTLMPAVGHIAVTAAGIGSSLRAKNGSGKARQGSMGSGDQNKLQTVRWVLACPARLENLVQAGQMAEAQADWAEVQSLLDRWEGTEGVEQIRRQAQAIMASE